MKRAQPGQAYEILIKHTADGPWLPVYLGPWTDRAEKQWYDARRKYDRRCRRRVRDAEVMALFYGHPDLIGLEAYFDRLYEFPGEPNDPPNRKGAA